MNAPVISIEAERVNRGLTVTEAAKQAGVSTTTWQRAEAGETLLPRNAFKIATFFGKKVTDIWPVETPEAAAA